VHRCGYSGGIYGTRCVSVPTLTINATDKAGYTSLLCVNRCLTLETQNRVIRLDMAVLRTFHTQRSRCRGRGEFQRSEEQTTTLLYCKSSLLRNILVRKSSLSSTDMRFRKLVLRNLRETLRKASRSVQERSREYWLLAVHCFISL
jgi:hypothetical protein